MTKKEEQLKNKKAFTKQNKQQLFKMLWAVSDAILTPTLQDAQVVGNVVENHSKCFAKPLATNWATESDQIDANHCEGGNPLVII